jgi:hypothetical protein
MPQVVVPRLPSMTPPRAGTAYAYLSWSVLIKKLNHLHGKPGDESCVHGTIDVPVSIQLTF